MATKKSDIVVNVARIQQNIAKIGSDALRLLRRFEAEGCEWSELLAETLFAMDASNTNSTFTTRTKQFEGSSSTFSALRMREGVEGVEYETNAPQFDISRFPSQTSVIVVLEHVEGSKTKKDKGSPSTPMKTPLADKKAPKAKIQKMDFHSGEVFSPIKSPLKKAIRTSIEFTPKQQIPQKPSAFAKQVPAPTIGVQCCFCKKNVVDFTTHINTCPEKLRIMGTSSATKQIVPTKTFNPNDLRTDTKGFATNPSGPKPVDMPSFLTSPSAPEKTDAPAAKSNRFEESIMEPQYEMTRRDMGEESNYKKKKVPEWAKGERLQRQLQSQKDVDPETIFVCPTTCDMRQMFGDLFNEAQYAAFNRRRSSGDWGQDQLTWKDHVEYKAGLAAK